MNKVFFATLCAIALPCISNANPLAAKVTESWECNAIDGANAGETVITTEVHNKNTGLIRNFGVSYVAMFNLDGLTRRWDFGLDESQQNLKYAFAIGPDGIGKYYDFSKGRQAVSPIFEAKCVNKKI